MDNTVEKKLRTAMAKLADKHVEKISVSALCELADVSRASFYLYYSDLEDLIIKTREYVINKLDQQLNLLLDVHDGVTTDKPVMILDDIDISLLKGYTEKHIYWDFAINANAVIFPRFEKKMIERCGEEYYNQNKKTFEFILNGGIATLYFDLLNYDKETYIRNMQRISGIAHELLPM